MESTGYLLFSMFSFSVLFGVFFVFVEILGDFWVSPELYCGDFLLLVQTGKYDVKP